MGGCQLCVLEALLLVFVEEMFWGKDDCMHRHPPSPSHGKKIINKIHPRSIQ